MLRTKFISSFIIYVFNIKIGIRTIRRGEQHLSCNFKDEYTNYDVLLKMFSSPPLVNYNINTPVILVEVVQNYVLFVQMFTVI